MHLPVPAGQDPSRVAYQLPCDLSDQPTTLDPSECTAAPCLFNIAEDPCECVPSVIVATSPRSRRDLATISPRSHLSAREGFALRARSGSPSGVRFLPAAGYIRPGSRQELQRADVQPA